MKKGGVSINLFSEDESESEDFAQLGLGSVEHFDDASGKLRGRVLEVPDITDDFANSDEETLQQSRPPHLPRVSDDELNQMRNYQIAHRAQVERLSVDPWDRFLSRVRGATNSVSRQYRIPNEPRGYGLSAPSEVAVKRETERVPFVAKKEVGGTFSSADAETREDLLANAVINEHANTEPQWNAVASDVIARDRMRQNMSWIDRPENSGTRILDDDVVFALGEAYEQVMSHNGSFRRARITQDDLIKDDTVSIHFAYIVAMNILKSRFIAPTRGYLQKLGNWISSALNERLRLMETYTVEPFTKRFVRHYGRRASNVLLNRGFAYADQVRSETHQGGGSNYDILGVI